MKVDRNIVHIHQDSASPLSQIRCFHTKAHCLRSRAFTSLVNKLFSSVINLLKRFADYRAYRQTYKELCAMDNRQLRDLGLTRNDLERVKQGKAGVQAIQQDYAAFRVKDVLATQTDIDSHHEVSFPRAMGQ